MNLRESIKIACAKRHAYQIEVANKCGVSAPHMSTIMRVNRCSTDTLEKIAKALDYKVSEFIALGE